MDQASQHSIAAYSAYVEKINDEMQGLKDANSTHAQNIEELQNATGDSSVVLEELKSAVRHLLSQSDEQQKRTTTSFAALRDENIELRDRCEYVSPFMCHHQDHRC